LAARDSCNLSEKLLRVYFFFDQVNEEFVIN